MPSSGPDSGRTGDHHNKMQPHPLSSSVWYFGPCGSKKALTRASPIGCAKLQNVQHIALRQSDTGVDSDAALMEAKLRCIDHEAAERIM